tara:strand:+ start:924 stop:2168 length:1245 start_codon:yes stop_codon:yes gene_type:complete
MKSNDYLKFENKFRGDSSDIMDLLSAYDSLIKIAIKNNPSSLLIDIGCGRGEFLSKWNDQISSIGIESNLSMVSNCRENGLKVLHGDALDKLSEFKNDSALIITIFHVVEHIEHKKLLLLIQECQRVLCEEGFLLIETPSIDNLIVSSKTFYLDHTHVNHINPEGIAYYLEQSGFEKVINYYINPGPLKNANPLKITRILNGVAQDLCTLAFKSEIKYHEIYKKFSEWEKSFNLGLSTLEAAIEHDLKQDSILNKFSEQELCIVSLKKETSLLSQEITLLKHESIILKNEILILRSELKYLLYFLKFLKKVLRPFIILLRKLFLSIGNYLFNFLGKFKIIQNLLLSNLSIKLLNFFFRRFIDEASSINSYKIKNKLNKLINDDEHVKQNNNKLLLHFQRSSKSNILKNRLYKGK